MGLYEPVLTYVGFLENGKLTKKAIDQFISETGLLINQGNIDGKTLVPLATILSIPPIKTLQLASGFDLFQFPPVPIVGPLIVNTLKDRSTAEMWYTIFIDTLLPSIASLLNIAGATPLAPIAFDPSGIFDLDPKVKIPLPFTPPDILKGLKVPMLIPEIVAKLPSISIPKIPSLPSLDFPTLYIHKTPNIKLLIPSIADMTLPKFMLGILKIPILALQQLLVPPKLDIVLPLIKAPPDISAIVKIVFDLLLSLLQDIFDLTAFPVTLIASLVVLMKDVVAMLVVVIISQLLGTGNIVKAASGLVGLI
jgi:hypothetical protein